MADKAVLTVALCCAGAVIGYMISSRMKKRMKYFTDIDDFLRGFIGSLDCSMDTVPEIMAAHPVGSELLKTIFAPITFISSINFASLICSLSSKASMLYEVNAEVSEIGRYGGSK